MCQEICASKMVFSARYYVKQRYNSQGHIRHIFVFFLLPVTLPAAHLTSHWNFPHISWASNSFELSDKSLFTTFVRSIGPLSEVGKPLVALFSKYNWERLGLLYVDYGKQLVVDTSTIVIVVFFLLTSVALTNCRHHLVHFATPICHLVDS